MIRGLTMLLWEAGRPHTHLVAGMYLALGMLASLWVVGLILAWVTPRLLALWERRRSGPLPVLTEVRVILFTLAMVCVMLLTIILVSDALLGQEWSLLFPLSPE